MIEKNFLNKFKKLSHNRILNILKKKEEERTFTDLQFLKINLKKIKYIRKVAKKGKSNLFRILRKLKYEKFEKNKIIFFSGNQPKKFYSIIKGSVLVLVKDNIKITLNKFENKKNKCENENILKKYRRDPRFFCSKTGNFLYNIVNILKKGEIFGELGLIQNEKRSATILTNEECEFAILERKDFLFPIKSEINKAITKKISYLQNIFELDISYNTQFLKIFPYFKKRKVKAKSYIYKEEDYFKNIIFIIKGNLILQKKNPKVLSEYLSKDSEIKNNFGNLFFDRSKNLRKINRNIIIYGKNKIIGIKEFKENLTNNFFSLKAKTDVKYYLITKENFEKCIKDFKICKLFFKNKIENEYQILNVV